MEVITVSGVGHTAKTASLRSVPVLASIGSCEQRRSGLVPSDPRIAGTARTADGCPVQQKSRCHSVATAIDGHCCITPGPATGLCWTPSSETREQPPAGKALGLVPRVTNGGCGRWAANLTRGYPVDRAGVAVQFVEPLDRLEVRQISPR